MEHKQVTEKFVLLVQLDRTAAPRAEEIRAALARIPRYFTVEDRLLPLITGLFSSVAHLGSSLRFATEVPAPSSDVLAEIVAELKEYVDARKVRAGCRFVLAGGGVAHIQSVLMGTKAECRSELYGQAPALQED